MKKYILLLLAVIFIPAEVLSYVTYISPEKLADESDLIIIGTVKEIQKSDEKIINSWGMRRGNVVQIYPVKYANVSIEEVLKGKPVSSVIVKFVFIKRKELDCQDPNLEAEMKKKVLLYLKDNNDQKGSYSVVYGWSGAVRSYLSIPSFKKKFYHQYNDIDFNGYVNKLKNYIKEKSLKVKK